MTRRDLFKVAGVTAASAVVTGCTVNQGTETPNSVAVAHTLMPKSKGKRVVIIGGGYGGLTAAKYIRKSDKTVEVVVLEKKDIFMSCPFSNTLLGGMEGVTLDTLTHDLYSGAQAHGYHMIQTEVTAINRGSKVVTTSKGTIDYDILVMAPGIAYNYEGQFKAWDANKIANIQQNAPAALMPGSEHLALKRQLENMSDGDVIITKPSGKYRCPPAPFERACMIAAYMEKEGINGKVIILNETKGVAKGAAFKEAWKELYGKRIVHMENCVINDVDMDKKEIHFTQTDSFGAEKKSHKFQVLNLIPHNKANPVVEMSGVETATAFNKVVMNGCSFQTKTDKSVYAVGDVVAHAIPPSGQTANWAAKQAAEEIVAQLNGKTHTLGVKANKVNAGNVCYSMVGDNPESAIMVTHDFSWDGTVIKGKGNVPKPKDGNGKFRSKNVAKATREWYRGIVSDLFA